MKPNLVKFTDKNYKIFILLLAFLLLLRSYHSFFNLSVGEHDWTFLILGKSLYNGYLPFIDTWVARGPLVFCFYAIPFIFENYIFTLKALNIIFLWITSIITYQTSNNLFGKNAALFSSFGFVLLASSEESFLTSETEIFILPFLAMFINQIFYNISEPSKKKIFYSGIFISLATLMRPSLGLIAVAGLFVFFYSKKNKLLNVFTYIIAGLIPLFIILVLYFNVSHGLEILWRSIFDINKAYSSGRPFLIGAFYFMDIFANKQWYGIIVLAALALFAKSNHKKEIIFMVIFLVLVLLGYLVARKFTDYYMLLSLPLVLVIVSSFYDKEK